MNEILLAQVKRKLNITWDDDDTNKRIEEIIDSAIPTLKHKLGIFESDFDFSDSGMENILFKNYCLYEWNHCVNEFDSNYSNEIAQIRAKWEVKYQESIEGVENEEE
jgi:hypothetical protein